MNTRAASVAPAWPDSSDREWATRLEEDSRTVIDRLPVRLVELHSIVVERAVAARVSALILSGSTARGTRTAISDLDYHLVGGSIDARDLSRELDLHVVTPRRLESNLLAGDDFVQWSLRFGLVVFDHGPAREALRLIARRGIWPDPHRKRTRAAKSLDLARRFVATGDHDGAVTQVRTALSLAARTYLLECRVFPLSRAELPEQLREAGRPEAGDVLTACLYETPSPTELDRAIMLGGALLRTSGELGRGARRRGAA